MLSDTAIGSVCNCTCASFGYSYSPPALVPRTLAAMRRCCVGHHIRIGLQGSDKIPIYRYIAEEAERRTRGVASHHGGFSGFLVALIDQMAVEMGFTYQLFSGTESEIFWAHSGRRVHRPSISPR